MENTKNKRDGEDNEPHFRSGRFYSIDNEWYFSVREKQDQGPFPTKEFAEEQLRLYLLDFAHFNLDKKSFDFYNIKIN